ncbi:hypothetical protein GIB67_021686 [Kingdonia uniflora]|uniref:Uncharacterized protein n=1 Tax=Kingdonia uniflora TaxID=39325 RepID=A0A7J7LLZ5_9MAGN|nr:hypothetical protein GIB67_021686 [Kingdonia uniflora]
MVAAALGGRDPSYLRMNSLDGFGDFQNWSGQGTQLSNASLASFQPGGMLGRVNSRPPMGFRGFGSPGTIQMGTTHNYSNSVNNLAKFQQAILPGNQSGNLLQGMPTSLHLDQFQQNKCVPRIGEFSNAVDPNFFAVSNGFSSTGVNIGSSNNSFMLHGQQLQQQTQSRGGFGNQSSARLAIVKSELVKAGSVIGNDQSRLSDNWQNSVPITGYPSNSLALNDHCFSHPDLATSNLRNNFSPSTPHSASSPLNVPDNSVGSVTVQDSRLDNNPKFSGFGSINGTSNQNINYFPKQRWESHKLEFNSNQMFSSSSSPAPVHSVVDSLGQNVGQNNAVNGNITSTLQLNCATPNFLQHNGIEKPASDSPIKFNGEYPVEQTKSQRGVNSKSCDSFEDLFSSISKQVKPTILPLFM